MKVSKKVKVFLFSTAVLTAVVGTSGVGADEVTTELVEAAVEVTTVSEFPTSVFEEIGEPVLEVETTSVDATVVVEPLAEELAVAEVVVESEETEQAMQAPSSDQSATVTSQETPDKAEVKVSTGVVATVEELPALTSDEDGKELAFQELLEKVHSGEILPDIDVQVEDSYTMLFAREAIPNSGTYHFKERLGIKSEAKINSADLAFYNAGQTVNYDSVLEADGHQWISYISYSGARRYIAINALATAPTATNNNTVPKTTVEAKLTVNGISITIDTNQVKDKTKILYAVWSDVDGQDDLKWYTADKEGKYLVKFDDHKGVGIYHVHTYSAETGKMVGLHNATVEVKQSFINRYNKNKATQTVATTPAQTIPSSGTYHFTGRSGIKAEPKVSSPDLAYYDNGMSVNYDSVINSDGKQWLSYLTYAGNRRYIAIGDAVGSTTPVATQPSTSVAQPSQTTTTNLVSPNARPQYQANTYPIGQCTWGAKEAASWVNNYWGWAGYSWLNNARAQGFTVGMTPSVGAVAVWNGHVAVVTDVINNNQIRVIESNVNGHQYLADHRGLFNPNATSNGAIIGYIYPPKV